MPRRVAVAMSRLSAQWALVVGLACAVWTGRAVAQGPTIDTGPAGSPGGGGSPLGFIPGGGGSSLGNTPGGGSSALSGEEQVSSPLSGRAGPTAPHVPASVTN